jgi:hypothetical protein
MTNFPVLLTRRNDYCTVLCTQDFKNTLIEVYVSSLYNFLIWFLKIYQEALFEELTLVLNHKKFIIFFQKSKDEDQQSFETLIMECQKNDHNCKFFWHVVL